MENKSLLSFSLSAYISVAAHCLQYRKYLSVFQYRDRRRVCEATPVKTFRFIMPLPMPFCNHNFCSSLTGTTPNRLYFWSGTIGEDAKAQARMWSGDTDNEDNAVWLTRPQPFVIVLETKSDNRDKQQYQEAKA